jgi:hypothetical protein
MDARRLRWLSFGLACWTFLVVGGSLCPTSFTAQGLLQHWPWRVDLQLHFLAYAVVAALVALLSWQRPVFLDDVSCTSESRGSELTTTQLCESYQVGRERFAPAHIEPGLELEAGTVGTCGNWKRLPAAADRVSASVTRTKLSLWTLFWRSVAVSVLLGLAVETLQALIPFVRRRFELADVLANSLGAMVGAAVVLTRPMLKRPTPSDEALANI